MYVCTKRPLKPRACSVVGISWGIPCPLLFLGYGPVKLQPSPKQIGQGCRLQSRAPTQAKAQGSICTKDGVWIGGWPAKFQSRRVVPSMNETETKYKARVLPSFVGKEIHRLESVLFGHFLTCKMAISFIKIKGWVGLAVERSPDDTASFRSWLVSEKVADNRENWEWD